MKIFTLVKSLFAVCVLLFSLNAIAEKTTIMEVSDYDSPEQFCSAVSKDAVYDRVHLAKYCGYLDGGSKIWLELLLDKYYKEDPTMEFLNGVCSEDTVSYRREFGKPLPSEEECLRVLEFAFKLSDRWDRLGVQREVLLSLSLIYDSIPDSEKRNWRDTYWNQALDIVEPDYTPEGSVGASPVLRARSFHPDLREIAVLREKNAVIGYMLYMGTKGLQVEVNSIKTYGTCTASIRYLDTQILEAKILWGEDLWLAELLEHKQKIEKDCKKKLLASSS